MSILKTEKLHYDYLSYRDNSEEPEITHALNGIDMSVEEGMFIAIVGNNGCGKSTLARHINALLFPTEGTVWICGMNTKNSDDVWKIRQNAGLVFQNPDNQIIASVAEEDVAFGPENLGLPTEEICNRVYKALEAVGMTAYRMQSPNKLSGGQKQRLAIAGVMAMEPRCIVLDEPTAMLDPSGRRECMAALKELNKKNKITVILITHYMDEAAKADRVIVMDEGNILLDGEPRSVFSNAETLKKVGLDVPQATELSGMLKRDGIKIPDTALDIDELFENIKAVLEAQ